jgi:hypothetical protein
MTPLRKLYEENKAILKEVRENFINEDLQGPLLMELFAYFEQSIKLFIIGQETAGWCCDYNDHESLLNTYKNFKMGKNYYSSPFWNITRKIEDIIGIQPYSCAWSNLNRYDHRGREPKGEILKTIKKLDYIISKEISVIKPDICMFFTNRKYDYRILELFPGIQMEPIEGLPYNHFVRLSHQSLPEYSFRTPHPKTIRIQKWEESFIKVMKKMLPRKFYD